MGFRFLRFGFCGVPVKMHRALGLGFRGLGFM